MAQSHPREQYVSITLYERQSMLRTALYRGQFEQLSRSVLGSSWHRASRLAKLLAWCLPDLARMRVGRAFEIWLVADGDMTVPASFLESADDLSNLLGAPGRVHLRLVTGRAGVGEAYREGASADVRAHAESIELSGVASLLARGHVPNAAVVCAQHGPAHAIEWLTPDVPFPVCGLAADPYGTQQGMAAASTRDQQIDMLTAAGHSRVTAVDLRLEAVVEDGVPTPHGWFLPEQHYTLTNVPTSAYGFRARKTAA